MQRPVGRKAMDGAVLGGIIVVLAFAIIGLISAGIFLADKASSSSSSAPKATSVPTGNNGITRAHAEATSIVQTAQQAGNAIVRSSTNKAKKQAAAIIAAANKKAAGIASSQPTSNGASTGTSNSAGSSSVTGGTTTGTSGSSVVTGSSSTALANRGSLPKSWLVVAYNASFGSGPGTAGGVAVLNRGRQTFSGTVIVPYNSGGSATAVFTNLAPGQAEVLPLNGPAYRGGGIRLIVSNVH